MSIFWHLGEIEPNIAKTSGKSLFWIKDHVLSNKKHVSLNLKKGVFKVQEIY